MKQPKLRFRTPFAPLLNHEKWVAEVGNCDWGKLLTEDLPRLRRLALIWDEILHENDGFPVAVELRNSSNQHAIIIPDPSYPGHFRAQYFDGKGFSGHTTYGKDPVKVLERLLMQGYEHRSDGALVAFTRTDQWNRGMKILQLKEQWESKRITWAEYTQKREEISTAYAS